MKVHRLPARKEVICLENYEKEYKLEKSHYDKILTILRAQLIFVKQSNAQRQADLQKSRREMWENAAHSADDFDRVAELSQFYLPLSNDRQAAESSAAQQQMLEKMLESAYFARIDFCVEGENHYDKIYIGRGTLREEAQSKIHIYDWRSPIAGLFYRFETGDAFYDAPGGRIAGNIALKRQFEIKNGIFAYFFDADVQITDAFLRKMLSGNTSGKMKTIVETIQKDQDIAIRDRTHDLLMIQGSAGSGKTSIALHRVAYLKYAGLYNHLKSSDIIILSPNTLFAQYISNVLPELGEEEVESILFDDLIQENLPENQLFQSRYDQLETMIASSDSAAKAIQKHSIEFKQSAAFIEILQRYADSLPAAHIDFTDIEYDGKTVFTARELRDQVLQMGEGKSLAAKLDHLRHHIFEKIHELRKERMPKLIRQAKEDPEHPYDWEEFARALSIEESTRLAKQVDGFVKLDSVRFYQKLIFTDGLLLSFTEGIVLPDTVEEILLYTRSLLSGPILQNEDALAITYFRLLIGRTDREKKIRQVVVDEAQDYDCIHFKILKRLFPAARYTILGDIHQTIEKQETMSLYERIREVMQPAKACLMTMNKSFRCTREILSFSMRFLDGDAPFESFNRSGDEPQVIEAADSGLLDLKIVEEAAYSLKQGYRSVAILCKDREEAAALYERLKDKISIRLIKAGDQLDTTQVSMIPITLSKGLEFDSVLVYGVSRDQYHSDDDKKLLYIACTRALHRLNLFYTGEKSTLL